MSATSPRLYAFCYPCPPAQYGWRYQCSRIGGVACAVCMVDVPPVTMEEASAAARLTFGWWASSSRGGGYDSDEWTREGGGYVRLRERDDHMALYATLGHDDAAWTLAGTPVDGEPMRPLQSALDDCARWMAERGAPMPWSVDDEDDAP